MLLKNFNQIEKSDVFLCGGKATSLGFMIQNDVQVPDGFVVTTKSFDLYQSNKILKQVQDDTNSVTTTTVSPSLSAPLSKQEFYKTLSISTLIDQIYSTFDSLNCKYVAVRSSATAEDSAQFSFAGQFDTFLNVTRENLIEKVFECFEGLKSARCLAYIAQTDLDISKIKVAVVVQKMIQSEVAGVAFTNHPVTKNTNQILIEGGYGLGEAVVSGQITPDNYLIDKTSLNIIDSNISIQTKGLFLSSDPKSSNLWQEIPKEKQNQQKLSNHQIQELAKTCEKIENLYGFPCDIEWALAEDQIYIVQSRPITTIT
jgi:pyruvate,water dikinase